MSAIYQHEESIGITLESIREIFSLLHHITYYYLDLSSELCAAWLASQLVIYLSQTKYIEIVMHLNLYIYSRHLCLLVYLAHNIIMH